MFVRLGMIKYRLCWCLTVRAWVFLLVSSCGIFWIGLTRAVSILSLCDRKCSDVLVTDGWLPDNYTASIFREFVSGRYKVLVITAMPLSKGSAVLGGETDAELTKAAMVKMGADPNQIEALSPLNVERDRTYAGALCVKRWLSANGIHPFGINVLSVGPHTRRTRLLYEKAFGSAVPIGAIALPNSDYDPKKWWRTSAGVRDVVGEWIAYLYARFVFAPTTHG